MTEQIPSQASPSQEEAIVGSLARQDIQAGLANVHAAIDERYRELEQTGNRIVSTRRGVTADGTCIDMVEIETPDTQRLVRKPVGRTPADFRVFVYGLNDVNSRRLTKRLEPRTVRAVEGAGPHAWALHLEDPKRRKTRESDVLTVGTHSDDVFWQPAGEDFRRVYGFEDAAQGVAENEAVEKELQPLQAARERLDGTVPDEFMALVRERDKLTGQSSPRQEQIQGQLDAMLEDRTSQSEHIRGLANRVGEIAAAYPGAAKSGAVIDPERAADMAHAEHPHRVVGRPDLAEAAATQASSEYSRQIREIK